MTFWNRLRTLRIFFQLVRDPNRTDLIFKGVDIVSSDPDQRPVQMVEQAVLSNDGFRRMYEDGYMPDVPQLERLKDLPANSFGHALYLHMNANALDFNLFPRLKTARAVHYLRNRIYQDHDLWHVLLGRGVTVEDELAIQAFGVAQFQSPVGTMIIAGGLLHLLGKDPSRAIQAFQQINEAYSLGKRAPFLLAVKVHDLLARPLSEAREICGLTGVSAVSM